MKLIFKNVTYILFVLLLILLLYFIYYFWPEEIVYSIWTDNVYVIIFLFSIIWWVFFLSSISFYATFLTFIFWWVDLIFLSLIAAFWLTIWDMFFYYFWKKTRVVAYDWKHSQKLKKISKYINKKTDRQVFLFILLYCSFSPLPKDLLWFSLWIIWYNIKKILLPFFMGNLIYNLLISAFSLYWLYLFN